MVPKYAGEAVDELVIPLPGQLPTLVLRPEKFPSTFELLPARYMFPFVATSPPLVCALEA